jgi:ubiquinone/menaquinone biosynthesis C-methylase UbiE
MSASDEAARIRAEYERREREIGRDFYSLAKPPNLFTRQHQERAFLRAIDGAGMLPLAEKKILEVGCGLGQWISMFEELGARREHIAGIDLDAVRIDEAQRRYPAADLRAGDATKLPWADASFDLVFQSTVFSSILDGDMRTAVAGEMRRVLRPGGVILWYDLRYDNPGNKNVRGINARELRELFPGMRAELEAVTLATPIVRRIVPRFWLAAAALERLKLLNTHFVATLRER